MQHLLNLQRFSKSEILDMLNLAREVKQNPENYRSHLAGKTLIMIFQKTSTRTRVSFEVGMTQLGGHAIFLDYLATNFTVASIRDEIQCISRYGDIIMARVYGQETIEEMGRYATVPVINGLSDKFHPCQALGDLLTIIEKYPDWQERQVAWLGDGNNVCDSLIQICAILGVHLNVITPEAYSPTPDIRSFAEDIAPGLVKYFHEPIQGIKDADVVYTDTWVSLGHEDEQETRHKFLSPYQVNMEVCRHARENYIFMHCLPAHRGFEVTDEILDSEHSVVYDQAENRLHAQKAVLLRLLEAA